MDRDGRQLVVVADMDDGSSVVMTPQDTEIEGFICQAQEFGVALIALPLTPERLCNRICELQELIASFPNETWLHDRLSEARARLREIEEEE